MVPKIAAQNKNFVPNRIYLTSKAVVFIPKRGYIGSMAEGLNKVILIGNLGADPELRFTQGGQAVLNMRLATTSSFQNKSGERQERTDWHTVSLWGARAEGLHKILSKGKSIGVEGRIQYRSWEDRDGNKRWSTDIVANNVLLLGGSGGGRSMSDGPGAGGPPADDFAGDNFSDDDIPF